MKVAKYICSHCGRRFEAEEKEILECPGCFWSTSVRKEEDWVEARSESDRTATTDPRSPKLVFRIPWRLILGLVLAGGIAAVLFVSLPRLKKIFEQKAVSENSAKPVTEKKPLLNEKKSKNQPPPSPLDRLTGEEKNILERRIQVSADRPLDEDEKKILDARASFKTGFSEKLPSQTWTIDGYKEMITQQERVYKVPFPRSYKKKLEDLFQAKYVPASEAFKNGELLKARDLWVESLAFPLYSKDLTRHRGVALTILRPFIADTLSKIGAINSSSVEKEVRAKEEALSLSYGKLSTLINQKAWKDSLDQISVIKKNLEGVTGPVTLGDMPRAVAYPAGINQVDPDIQASLFELLKVPPPPTADFEPLRSDVLLKERLIHTFLPEGLGAIQAMHDEGLDAIRQTLWKEAQVKFRGIDAPPSYYKDAQEKIRILKKLEDSTLGTGATGSTS